MTANQTIDTRPVVAAISDLVPDATSPWGVGTAVQALPVGASATAILHALIDDRVDADLSDTDVDSFLARNPDLAFDSVDDLLGDDWA